MLTKTNIGEEKNQAEDENTLINHASVQDISLKFICLSPDTFEVVSLFQAGGCSFQCHK